MPVDLSYNEKRLLLQIAEHDQMAFTQLYHHYLYKVYGYAMRYLQLPHLAEEVVQDVFTKIWLHKTTLPVIENFEAYLFTMTRNTCFKHLQKTANELNARTEWANRSGIMEALAIEPALQKEYNEQLHQSLELLPPRQRITYVMHLQGFKNGEIADTLAISKNTVKVHLVQAAKVIRQYFNTLQNVLFPILVSFLINIF